MPLVSEELIGMRAVRASKPGESTPNGVEGNCAHYNVGAGKQPSHDSHLQQCVKILVPVNRLKARVLLDRGSSTNMVSPEFATVVKIPAIKLQEQMTLQLAVMGVSLED